MLSNFGNCLPFFQLLMRASDIPVSLDSLYAVMLFFCISSTNKSLKIMKTSQTMQMLSKTIDYLANAKYNNNKLVKCKNQHNSLIIIPQHFA